MVEIKELTGTETIDNEKITQQLIEEFPCAFKKIKDPHDGEILFQAGINDPQEFVSMLNNGRGTSPEMKEHLSSYQGLHDEVISNLINTKNQKVFNSVLRLISYESMKNGGPCFSKKGILLPFETADVYIPPCIIATSLNAFTEDAKRAFFTALTFVNTYNMLLNREKHIKKN
ncbi:MAG TPA: hypothetical protein PKH06_01985 [Candidatus Dojkabacteria bacterium]|nr:hypothetical protein [Candidatus Dojkabacteria bacterium]